MTTIVAIDLGTQSLRVSAVVGDGSRRFAWQRPVTTIADGIRQEQDPAEWQALLDAGLSAAAKDGVIPDVVLASGPLAGWAPLAVDGSPLGPAVMYNDARAEADLAPVEAVVGADGRVPRVTIADPLPQVLRLAREEPAVFACLRHFLDATGWLNFALTGEATLNDYTALRLYDASVRTMLGLGRVPFGRRVAIGETIAPLRAAIADRLGWPRVPVVAATFDSKCAYLGSGIRVEGDALDISGTVTSFGVVSNDRVIDPENRIYSVPFGDRFLVRGSTAAAGSALEWARSLFGLEVSDLDRLAAAAPPSPADPIFVPYLYGARAPLWRPQARGTLVGLDTSAGRGDVTRALYCGLALSLRHIVATIESCGVKVATIRLAGGLARSPVLAQIKADILGRPVVKLAETELTTTGLAAIGAASLGVFSDIASAARTYSVEERTFAPAIAADVRDLLFARYLAAAGLSVRLAPKARAAASLHDDWQRKAS